MKDITELSAMQLVRLYNAVTDGTPKKKFESTPRGRALTIAEIERLGMTVDVAMLMAFAGDKAIDPPTPPLLLTHDKPEVVTTDGTVVTVEVSDANGTPVIGTSDDGVVILTEAEPEAEAEPDLDEAALGRREYWEKRGRAAWTATEKADCALKAKACAPIFDWQAGAGEVLNLATGKMIPKPQSVHGPLRDTPANPEGAARKVAKAAGRAARAALAIAPDVPETAPGPAQAPASRGKAKLSVVPPSPAPAMALPAADADLSPPRADWHRTNRTVPLMIEAMREKPGKTLAELQVIGRWGAPVEPRHLRKMEQLAKVRIVHDDDAKKPTERRYFILAA